MPEYTTRLNLPKPLGNENVTRANHNALVDAIDANAAKKSDLDTANQQISSLSQNLNTHSSDNTKHITAEERAAWNAKQNALGYVPEPSFNKNTAFNKNFGTTAGTVAEGNHIHPTKVLASGTDLNNVVDTGFYDGTNLVNAPSSAWHYIQVIRHTGDSAGNRWVKQIAWDFNTGKMYSRQCAGGVWLTWKGVGGVDYKTYTSTTGLTNLGNTTAVDFNLVNVNGKGFVDVLTASVMGINLSLADGIEMIVDGQILWSSYSDSGNTNGNLLDSTYPLIGVSPDGYGGQNPRFDRVYFNSSFRVRVFGTTASNPGGSYEVKRFSYHLEQ